MVVIENGTGFGRNTYTYHIAGGKFYILKNGKYQIGKKSIIPNVLIINDGIERLIPLRFDNLHRVYNSIYLLLKYSVFPSSHKQALFEMILVGIKVHYHYKQDKDKLAKAYAMMDEGVSDAMQVLCNKIFNILFDRQVPDDKFVIFNVLPLLDMSEVIDAPECDIEYKGKRPVIEGFGIYSNLFEL